MFVVLFAVLFAEIHICKQSCKQESPKKVRLGSTTKKEFYDNFASACKNRLNPYLDGQRTVRIGGQAQEVRAEKARHDATTADRQNQVGECFNSTLS